MYSSYLFLKKILMAWQLSIESELQMQLMDNVVDRGDYNPKQYQPRWCPTDTIWVHHLGVPSKVQVAPLSRLIYMQNKSFALHPIGV